MTRISHEAARDVLRIALGRAYDGRLARYIDQQQAREADLERRLAALSRIIRRSLACGQLEKLEDAKPYLDDTEPTVAPEPQPGEKIKGLEQAANNAPLPQEVAGSIPAAVSTGAGCDSGYGERGVDPVKVDRREEQGDGPSSVADRLERKGKR